MSESVGVIGAGPVGCLTAIALAKKGYFVTLFDYRKDPRIDTDSSKEVRSINLALSNRGLCAIRAVDEQLYDIVVQNVTPMKGRMVHHVEGHLEEQMYGLDGECINSVDRASLNIMLLNMVSFYQEKGLIKLEFDHKLKKIVFDEEPNLHRCEFLYPFRIEDTIMEYDFNFVLGCDGTYSETREQMQKYMRMDFNQEYLERCYIELNIPSLSSKFDSYNESEDTSSKFAMPSEYLHMWPRDDFLLSALPNLDGSFTCTFFGTWDLTEKLMKSKESIKIFLLDNFRDAVNLMGVDKAVESFYNNPKGKLMCVECHPYHIDGGKALILGDAAHSMVPFYNQGLNCGLEDIRILMELLEKYKFDRAKSFEKFSQLRFKDHSAIIQLSKNNFKMITHSTRPNFFSIRNCLDNLLARLLKKSWLPLHYMVSFKEEIPYHEAVEIANRQNKVINTILSIFTVASASAVYNYWKHKNN